MLVRLRLLSAVHMGLLHNDPPELGVPRCLRHALLLQLGQVGADLHGDVARALVQLWVGAAQVTQDVPGLRA